MSFQANRCKFVCLSARVCVPELRRFVCTESCLSMSYYNVSAGRTYGQQCSAVLCDCVCCLFSCDGRRTTVCLHYAWTSSTRCPPRTGQLCDVIGVTSQRHDDVTGQRKWMQGADSSSVHQATDRRLVPASTCDVDMTVRYGSGHPMSRVGSGRIGSYRKTVKYIFARHDVILFVIGTRHDNGVYYDQLCTVMQTLSVKFYTE